MMMRAKEAAEVWGPCCESHVTCFLLQIHARRCLWVYVIKDILMSLSGKGMCDG